MYSLFWLYTQCVGLAFSISMPMGFLGNFYDNMALSGEMRNIYLVVNSRMKCVCFE